MNIGCRAPRPRGGSHAAEGRVRSSTPRPPRDPRRNAEQDHVARGKRARQRSSSEGSTEEPSEDREKGRDRRGVSSDGKVFAGIPRVSRHGGFGTLKDASGEYGNSGGGSHAREGASRGPAS